MLLPLTRPVCCFGVGVELLGVGKGASGALEARGGDGALGAFDWGFRALALLGGFPCFVWVVPSPRCPG